MSSNSQTQKKSILRPVKDLLEEETEEAAGIPSEGIVTIHPTEETGKALMDTRSQEALKKMTSAINVIRRGIGQTNALRGITMKALDENSDIDPEVIMEETEKSRPGEGMTTTEIQDSETDIDVAEVEAGLDLGAMKNEGIRIEIGHQDIMNMEEIQGMKETSEGTETAEVRLIETKEGTAEAEVTTKKEEAKIKAEAEDMMTEEAKIIQKKI